MPTAPRAQHADFYHDIEPAVSAEQLYARRLAFSRRHQLHGFHDMYDIIGYIYLYPRPISMFQRNVMMRDKNMLHAFALVAHRPTPPRCL